MWDNEAWLTWGWRIKILCAKILKLRSSREHEQILNKGMIWSGLTFRKFSLPSLKRMIYKSYFQTKETS